MKYIKWIVVISIVLLIILLLFLLFYQKHKEIEDSVSLFEMEEYKKIQLEKIKQINILSYTEGGSESVLEEDKDSIQKTYLSLSRIRVGKETNMACEDNTTVYVIQLEDETEISIEIECDWLVVGNERYKIVH